MQLTYEVVEILLESIFINIISISHLFNNIFFAFTFLKQSYNIFTYLV